MAVAEEIADRAIVALERGQSATIEGAVLAVEPAADQWTPAQWRLVAAALDARGYPGVSSD